MLSIHGSRREGGGQILRTALGLAAATGTPFPMLRSSLNQQDLDAIHAAATISGAEVHGAESGSRAMTFVPGEFRAGEYRFGAGRFGNTSLLLHTILPPLLLADRPSQLQLEGNTHELGAPPLEFLQKVLVPLIGRMGVEIEMSLERIGFPPAGGGAVTVTVRPGPLRPLEIVERGQI